MGCDNRDEVFKRTQVLFTSDVLTDVVVAAALNPYWDGLSVYSVKSVIKGAVSRNSAKLGNYKMPVKLGETKITA